MPKKRSNATRRKTEKNHADEIAHIERPLTLVAQVEQTLRRAIGENAFPDGRLPTTVDLADRLGVSRETVRLALDTLQQEGLVVKHRRRGTLLNHQAVPESLPRTATKLLGYLQADYRAERGEAEVVTRATSSFMFDGALVEAGMAGYQLIVRSAKILQLREAFDQLNAAGNLQGIVFASIAEEKFLRKLSGLNIPAVLLDHDLHLPKLGSIRGDSLQCSRLAVEHLAQLGHRHIACAEWRQDDLNPWFIRGYREGMRTCGLKCRRSWELAVELTRTGAGEAIGQLLDLTPRPTAVICFHNTFAHYLIDAAAQRGLHTPEDLSVVGGGGEEVIGLSCNQLDWYRLGREAMRMLLRGVEADDQYKPEHVLAPYTFCPGRTTRAL